jgi:hypothetical protein
MGSTCDANQQDNQTFDNRTARITEFHRRTPRKRDDQKIEEPLCGILLFHQEKEWEVKTCARLPTDQQMDDQELIPPTSHPTTN